MQDLYPEADTGRDPTIPDATTMDNSQPQNSPIGNSASGDELAAYIGPTTEPRDLLDELPGETYTQDYDTATEYGDYRPITVAGVVAGESVQIAGWSFYDTTNGATPFTVTLRDGIDAGARVIAVINLNNSVLWALPGGIRTMYGLYAQFNAGTVQGTVFIRSVRRD